MDKEILKYVLAQSARRALPELTPRTTKLPLDSGKIVAVVGVRRSGKTFLLYATMKELIARGVDRRCILYLNFEDDRLLPIRTDELDSIFRAHEELFPDVADERRYVFFDEIQNLPSWENYLRRLHDTENVGLFVTGSSSHLLSRDIATGLRGRSVSFEVFPLSFTEFLRFRGVEHEPYSRTSESKLAAALEDYLRIGGLPEIVSAEESLRPRILKEYVDLLFYRDLVERHNVGNPRVMRLLLRYCLANPASLMSAHKLYNDLRSQGLGLSKDTVYNYLDHLEDSYVLFTLPVAERSLRKREVNPKKLHPIDWSLAYPFVPAPRIDVGRKLESAVFLHWRRRSDDLGYMAGSAEVDLVVHRDAPERLVNVAYSLLEDSTWNRELHALETGATRFPHAEREVVAHELAKRRPPAGTRVVDAWRYLLELSGENVERGPKTKPRTKK